MTPARIIPVDARDDAVSAYLRIRNEVAPDQPDGVDQVRWERATYPGQVFRFLALGEDRQPAGTATSGRIWVHGPEYERAWLGIWVLPGQRHRGIGHALYEACSREVHAIGKTGFETQLSERHADGHAFLRHRGFVETGRSKVVTLDLRGLEAPEPALPAGFTLTTLEARPDLLAGVHAIALDAFPDIPSGDEPMAVGTLEEFAARDVDRPAVPRDAFTVIVDDATGEAVAYASLMLAPGSRTLAWHEMTAVRRAYRGRGLATAAKLATIAWAARNGLQTLETGNDSTNAPMRAVNAKLGYRPAPDAVDLRGPLAPGT
ncbi:MAG TPA: GNAT family N-acetyltransferase [Candidatus Limnocylindrales bacterium]|nr:GNAT family N-acetyltransferase [Candidatus Limnocylindrales bacterium]